ncbi:CAP domain-containing protein [Mycena sp. CBHHK59/15]|nr:CAP domain-containing protein [Mycena sp. CBHHK59/15]
MVPRLFLLVGAQTEAVTGQRLLQLFSTVVLLSLVPAGVLSHCTEVRGSPEHQCKRHTSMIKPASHAPRAGSLVEDVVYTTVMTTSKANAPVASTSTSFATVSAVSTTTSGSQSGLSDDSQTYLSIHNLERSKYGASDLVWNDTLGSSSFSPLTGYVCFTTFPENLVAAWIDTSREATYSPVVPSHWSQMVWKSTTDLGCAALYYVCEYWPAGNVIGEFGDNVQN